ncbi:MAG: choice-of-anchor J domain-containing protein [Flavobacterium sp.]|nr:choice-of-anchor J domain-containing protein [Flavobacterium sp.]
MKKINIFLTALLSTAFVGCVNDTYDTPDVTKQCEELTVTKTAHDIAALATTTVQSYNTVSSNTPDVIEAYVTSSDEGGNFYKNISFVTIDGTKGFTMPVNDYNLYSKYEPGRKVFIKMKDRYFYNNTTISSLEIGNLYHRGAPLADQVGRIEINEYKDVIKRSCTKVDEEEILNTMTIPAALNNANLNKLIEFENVQFADDNVGKTYFDSANQIGGATNNTLIDNAGNTVVVRVSEFATFAAAKIPGFNGKVRGVLTKFNSGFQLMIRTLNDVNLTNTRIDYSPPIVGNANVFSATLNEPFTSYAVNLANFPKYINDADFGSRYWQVKQFTTAGVPNKYIEMTSYAGSSSPGVRANTFFIVPVDLTAANTMTFNKQFRFYRGSVCLKVYYVRDTDYTGGSVVDRSKLTDITSEFAISYPAIGASDSGFSNVGIYNIPTSLTGNGYFLFEYIGTTTQTTTTQIDDIVIN